MLKGALAFITLLAWAPGVACAQSRDTLCIEHVNVVPMTAEVVLKNQRVVIAGGKIVRLEPASRPRRYRTAAVVDGRGKYLIPGLAEMHYHFRSQDSRSDFKLLAANGITTVRNMAEPSAQNLAAIRRGTATGELLPLNYFSTGPYLTARDLPTAEQVEQTVRMHKENGYDFLKIADNLPQPLYVKLLEECQAHKLPVVGHAQRSLPLEYSLRMKSIEHVEEFVYLSDSTGRPSYYKRSGPELQKLAEQVKASGVYVGTTLGVFEFITQCLDDKEFARLRSSPLVKYLAKAERENFLTEKNDYRKMRGRTFDGEQAPAFFNGYFSWIKQFTRLLATAGVPLLGGSDTYGMVIVGFSLHHEFELLQAAGLRPYDILRASTVTPARYLNTLATEGTIAEGKNANLVLLDNNPLADIRNTKAIAGVLLQGQWLSRKELNQMLGEVEAAYK